MITDFYATIFYFIDSTQQIIHSDSQVTEKKKNELNGNIEEAGLWGRIKLN